MALRISIPPVTRVLLILIVSLSFLYNVARFGRIVEDASATTSQPTPLVPYLALVPSVCIFYPWTLLSASFVEQNVVTLLINSANIFFGGKYLERAWGSRAFAMVVVVAALVPNLIIVPTYILWGAVMGNTTRAQTPITGGITLQAAFLVAFKQLVPEHSVSVYKGVVKIRVKHFPAIFLVLNTLGGILLGTDTALLLAWYGLVTTWVYLRFHKWQPDVSGSSTGGEGSKGDASETFAFATFFPNALQPPIARACDQIFTLLCSVGICRPFSDEAVASGNEQAAARGENGLPNIMSEGRSARAMGKREEAERRRALALKALDQRLANARVAPVTVNTSVSGDQEALGQTDYEPDNQ